MPTRIFLLADDMVFPDLFVLRDEVEHVAPFPRPITLGVKLNQQLARHTSRMTVRETESSLAVVSAQSNLPSLAEHQP